VHLSAGLAVILGFIGVKLISQALRGYGVYHLGPVPVPQVSAGVSLAVIAGVLVVTTVTSLAARRRQSGEAGVVHEVSEAGRASHVGQTGREEQAGQTHREEPADWTGHPHQNGRAGQAGQVGVAGRADEEGWPGAERSQPLPWAGRAPSARRTDGGR
jgi:hypothetical protein